MKITTFFSLLILLFALNSCKKYEDNPELPDLLFEFAFVAQDEIDIGNPLVLESSIENQADVSCGCETETAVANDRSTRVQYRPDENSAWVDAQLVDQNGTITYELVRPVPEIQSGKKHQKSESYVFQKPGIYRYQVGADVNLVVKERIEFNNEANANDGIVRSDSGAKFKLMVRVKDPTGVQSPVYDPGVPVSVLYLGEK